MVKLEMISGPFQAILFTVITWNPESNCTCREKNHFLFHWNTLTWQRLQIHRWMECWRNISTIIGTLMEIENCQIRGQVPQDSLYWVKNHWVDTHGPGGDWQENKRPPDQTLCGQRFGKICPMRRNAKKSKSGLSKNQSLTMPENCVVFTSLILMMENLRISWRMRVESWKFRCQPQCFAKFNVRSTGKPVALKRSARQNTLALLRPMNLRGSAWKDLFTRINEDHIAGKGMNSLSHYNLVRKFIHYVPQSNENTRCKSSSGEIMEKTRENTGMAADESQKHKMRWSLKQGMRAKPYTLRRKWTSVISRIRSWSHSFKNTKVELYSEVT